MRFLARLAVVATVTGALVAGLVPGAESARKPPRLKPPTNHVVDHVTCVQTDETTRIVRAY